MSNFKLIIYIYLYILIIIIFLCFYRNAVYNISLADLSENQVRFLLTIIIHLLKKILGTCIKLSKIIYHHLILVKHCIYSVPTVSANV